MSRGLLLPSILLYLETLVEFTEWLFAHEYDVRLLTGDIVDTPVTQEFKTLLKKRSVTYRDERIIDEPIASVDDLLKQLAATDVVVATRFHNVLLALLLNKPVIAISFHHKCISLMSQMGLARVLSGHRPIELSHADRTILATPPEQRQRETDDHGRSESLPGCAG